MFSLLVAAFFLVGGVALLRDTALQGQDFDVFWNTARHVLNGQPPYDLVRDGGMVYKYPPWTLPAFFPLAVFPLESARWIWAAIELASLTYVGFWLLRAGVKRVVLLTLYPLFWGIWAVHAMDGQVTLAILALVLWLQEQRTRSDALTIVKTGWALSFKVFTLFAALPLRRRFARTRVLALSVLVAGALSVPCL
ncbi:MAG: glycosyltransferase 87 family protein, partial [Bdellovibrionota bacterium]